MNPTVLLIVTLCSALVALVMCTLAWRAAREEHHRADARIAALRAEIFDEPSSAKAAVRGIAFSHRPAIGIRAEPPRRYPAPAPRPVSRPSGSWHESQSAAPGWQGATTEHIGNIRERSNAVSRDAPPGNHVANHRDGTPSLHLAIDDLPLRAEADAAPHDLFEPAAASRSVFPSGPAIAAAGLLLAGAAAALFVVTGLGPPGVARRIVPSAPAATTVEAPLQLIALSHDLDDDQLIVRGTIRTLAPAADIGGLAAVVFAFDGAGGFVTSGRAAVDASARDADGTVPFVVAIPGAADVSRYRVSFRAGDRIVPHIDKRHPAVRVQLQ
jgi:hypothetical protein